MIMGLSGFLKNKKACIILVGVLVLIASAAAAYFVFGGKSAREFYLEAESRNFKQYADLIKKTYSDFNESRKPYLSNSYKSRTEITLEFGEGGSLASDNSVKGILDVIEKCKLIVDSKNNPGAGENLTELSLLLEKTPFLDAEIFSRGKELHFTVPVFTPDKYFRIDTARLEQVYDRFGIPVKPLRPPSLIDTASALKLDPVEFDRLASEYGSFISESIKEADVKYGNIVDMDISGQMAKGRQVTVEMDSAAFTALLEGLAARAGNDDAFAMLTYGNLAEVSRIADEAGLFRLFEFLDKTGAAVLNDSEKQLLSALNLKKDLEGFKSKLSQLFKNCDFKAGVKMDMVIDASGKILDRKVVTAMKDVQSGVEYEVVIHTGTNSIKYNDYRNRYLELELVTKPAGVKKDRQYLRFNPSIAPGSKEGDHKGVVEISLGIDAEDGMNSSTTVKLELESKTDELTARENSTTGYSIEMQGSAEGQPEKVTGELKTSRWKNNKLKTRNQTTSFSINAELPDFGITGLNAVLSLAKEDKLEIGSFSLPEAAAGSVVDLNSATDAELNKVWEDIMGSFGTFYMTNKPIVDAVLGE